MHAWRSSPRGVERNEAMTIDDEEKREMHEQTVEALDAISERLERVAESIEKASERVAKSIDWLASLVSASSRGRR